MKNKSILDLSNIHRVSIDAKDIIRFGYRIRNILEGLCSFSGYSLRFPKNKSNHLAKIIESSKELHLPLHFRDDLLGIIVLSGVDKEHAKRICDFWPSYESLLVDNILTFKKSLCDPTTGLYSRAYFVSALAALLENDLVEEQNSLGKNNDKSSSLKNLYNSTENGEVVLSNSCGVLSIRFLDIPAIAKEFSYQFAEDLFIALSDVVLKNSPESAIVARIGDRECGVLLPGATFRVCKDVAEKIYAEISTTTQNHILRKKTISSEVSIGISLYPRDISGKEVVSESLDKARLLLRKARLAAILAGDRALLGSRESILSFSQIIKEGGRIISVYPFSRVQTNLGTSVQAKEGQHFAVWGSAGSSSGGSLPVYKGEISIVDVEENTSQAEIIHLGKPEFTLESGDRLILLAEDSYGKDLKSSNNLDDDSAKVLSHSEFLAKWYVEREEAKFFSLALIEILDSSDSDSLTLKEKLESLNNSTTLNIGLRGTNEIDDALKLCLESISKPKIVGKYGSSSRLMYFDNSNDLALEFTKATHEVKKALGLDLVVGIGAYPCLDFNKSDILENSKKALEYAKLLDAPHVGTTDSLALNIRGDKLFSQSDVFEAIKEYQRALILDPKNILAWNSLGVCFAGLKKLGEAEGCFAKALECDSSDANTYYNLGYIYQLQQQFDLAKEHFLECIKYAPEHLFALLRLGQIFEKQNFLDESKNFYLKVLKLPGGKGLACRYLARLEIILGNSNVAREYLHEALIYNPQDATALSLLANIFLDAGEDPEIVVSLSKQSVALAPELRLGWFVLAKALEQMGDDKGATEARLKGGSF